MKFYCPACKKECYLSCQEHNHAFHIYNHIVGAAPTNFELTIFVPSYDPPIFDGYDFSHCKTYFGVSMRNNIYSSDITDPPQAHFHVQFKKIPIPNFHYMDSIKILHRYVNLKAFL